MFYDIDNYYGGDIGVSPTGDLGNVSGITRSQQRILRRLLTNPMQTNPDGSVLPPDYIFHPTYGAGLARYIGEPGKITEAVGRIKQQMVLEASVSQNPPPAISVEEIPNGLSVTIQYTDLETNQTTTLSFNVNQ